MYQTLFLFWSCIIDMYQLEISLPNMSTICFDDGDEGPPAWYPSVDPPKSHWENMSKCWNVGILPMEMTTFGEYVYIYICVPSGKLT